MTQQEIIEKLQRGNERFVNNTLENANVDQTRRNELTGGQSPFAIVLGCADSRVVPEHAFDMGLGEIFTVRVAGNVANASSLASIEYAVAHLKSKVIVVLGHEACGAVGACMQGGDLGPNLNHLLSHIQPAVDQLPGADIADVVKKNANLVAQDLVGKSTIISDAVQAGNVKIVPAYYRLSDGKVEFL